MISRIAEHVSISLTVDIEGGYAVDNNTLAYNMEPLLQLDICGINFEDQKVNHPNDELWETGYQSLRIRTIQLVAAKLHKRVFINARTDIFFKHTKHSMDLVVMDGMISNHELQELGVKRISYGPHSFFQAQRHLQGHAQNIVATQNFIKKRADPTMITNQQEIDKYYEMLVEKNSNYGGVFFVGVKTTGIICRPTCPAKKPYKQNCEFSLLQRKLC